MVLAAALSLQNFRHFVSGGIGSVPLEVAGNGEDGVAHAHFGHAVWAADGGLLAGGVGHVSSFPEKTSLPILAGEGLIFCVF